MRALAGNSHRWSGRPLHLGKACWLREGSSDLTVCHQELQRAKLQPSSAAGRPEKNPFLKPEGDGVSVFVSCRWCSVVGIKLHRLWCSRFGGVFAPKPQVLRPILEALEHFISHRRFTASCVRGLVRGCSTSLTAPGCLGSHIENSRPATPKWPDDSNNQALTCYALVTHTGRVRLRKCFRESHLQKFFPLWIRSWRSLSLGQQNKDFPANVRKSPPSVSPKTTKTPVCVTHKLRTPATFWAAGCEVASQTQKVGVMRMLCISIRAVWTHQNAVADLWPQSE